MYMKIDFTCVFFMNMRNASNTHFSTHSLWLVKIHMGPTKFIWDLHDLVGLMWILTNQRECVGKCVLECVLLAFLILTLILHVIYINFNLFEMCIFFILMQESKDIRSM